MVAEEEVKRLRNSPSPGEVLDQAASLLEQCPEDALRPKPEVDEMSPTNSRNPRHFDTIEGGRVYQALHI